MNMDMLSVPENYVDVLAWLIFGSVDVLEVSGEKTHEIVDINFTIRDTEYVLPTGTKRGVSTSLGTELALQLIAGRYLPERLKFINPHFDDDPKLENYGPLLRGGIRRAVSFLAADPTTRRAAANLGHTGGESGYPCTVGLGWLIRKGQLHAFSSMRSQDAWLGFPYDIHMFASLQHNMARILGVEPGPLHHHVRSFHLYERNVEAAKQVTGGLYGEGPPVTQVDGYTWGMTVTNAQLALLSD